MTHPAKQYTRRNFLTEGAAVAAGLGDECRGSCRAKRRNSGGRHEHADDPVGQAEVSRLILGSNPFWGFWHGNPRKPKAYSQQGRKCVLDAAAAEGITAIWCPAYPEWIALWQEYKENGGKLQSWMGQPDGYRNVTVVDQIKACASNGGQAVCIQGENVDNALAAHEYDKLRRWLGLIRDLGLPAGLASHRPESILAAEEAGSAGRIRSPDPGHS